MFPNIFSYKLSFWIAAFCVFSNKLISVYSETPSSNMTDETCESLRGHSGSKLNVLVVGLLKKSLLLVTKDWVVYDTPMTSLNLTLHRLSLTDPVPMETKYPKLWNDEKFQKTKPIVMDTMTMVDEKSELLCFVTYSPKYGVNYDLNKQEVSNGWQQVEKTEEVFISTPEYNKFFATKKGKHGIEIAQWEMDPKKKESISPIEEYRPICWVKESETIMIQKPEEDCGDNKPVKWPILKGFVAEKTFYLFGQESVHLFPFDTYGSEAARPVVDIQYADFFWCPGDTENDSSSSKLWLMMALIILLLILLCLILCCANYIYQKQKKSGKRRKFNPQASMASIRSSGGSNAEVGILTKVFSSTTTKPKKGSKTKGSKSKGSKSKGSKPKGAKSKGSKSKGTKSKKPGKTNSKRKSGRRKQSRSKTSK